MMKKAETPVASKQEPLSQPLPPVRIDTGSPDSWTDVRRGLEGLGFQVCFTGEPPAEGEVILVVDGTFPAAEGTTPIIYLARERSVRSAQSALATGASGYFAAPFDYLAVGVAICAAAAQARALADSTARVARLGESIANDQLVNTVVGILMERFKLQRGEAYARLRQYSRTERRKLVELASQIIATTEELGHTMHAINNRTGDL
jgi:hypothetical protein